MFAAANISERLKCSCIDSYSSIIRVTDLLSGEYHHLSYVFNAREKERTGPPGSDLGVTMRTVKRVPFRISYREIHTYVCT